MMKPKYGCSQANLYAICTRAWHICRDNQAAFFAFDPLYTEGYIDDNLAQVKIAENLPDAKSRQEDLSLLSIEYDKVANEVVAQAKYLRSYIERAYQDKAIQRIMLQSAGFDYFSKVLKLDDKAITPFMSSAVQFIANKAVVLTTDGRMPADFATKFNAADAAFDDVLAQYNATQSATKIKTEEKIKANNDIYDRVQAMLYDGRFMHLENPALAQAYNFNTIWDQIEPTKNSGVGGKTLAVGGKKSVPNVTVTESLTGKTTISDKDGSYSLLLTEGKWLLIFSADGYVSQTIEVVIQKGVTKRLNVEMVTA
ncbi:MAG: carboxypeptidase-like regulatory domain-containing protein [Saprospiraceae bacterium]|nr:carboxypeptidase-like regulatory domain-containing protein [Saprospiraceae bacterium]